MKRSGTIRAAPGPWAGASVVLPNTNEYTDTFTVQISAKDDTEKTISLDTFDHQIKMVSPEDRGFKITEWNSDQTNPINRVNIFANKGSGFRFAAYGELNGEYQYFWLADIRLKSKYDILIEYNEKK